MTTFQVPQFIEQEARIIGPLTLKQFLYVALAAVISFVSFQIFNFFLWFSITTLFGGGAIAMAFVKINGQSLLQIIQAALNYLWNPRTYTWQRIAPETAIETSDLEKIKVIREHMNFEEKLKSIALSITTGKLMPQSQKSTERYQTVTYVTGERKTAKRVDY